MPVRYEIFSPDTFHKTLWKNGLGYTTELLREDMEDGSFAWRISIAQVSEDGPFSDFTGYDRNLLLLNGKGITLDYANGKSDCLQHKLEIASFDGAVETCSRLHDGPIEDFNIMTHQTTYGCHVYNASILHHQFFIASDDLVLVYAASEHLNVKCRDEAGVEIHSGHLLKIEGCRKCPISIEGHDFVAIDLFSKE